jgi:2-C-methyl-D-erythritol 4-phosphate cytidylyltransferase
MRQGVKVYLGADSRIAAMPPPPLTDSTPRCFALVPCAGVGERAAAVGPKQYAPVAGQALVAHTLRALSQVPRLAATLVVLAPGDDQFEAAAPAFTGPRAWVAHCGGTSRAHSVLNGLQALAERGAQANDWVLVHDAARCLIEPSAVNRLIDACQHDSVGGLLAWPLADTLKQAQGDRVVATIHRADKWLAQTPQMFRLGLLQQALQAGTSGVTDEASAIEKLGHAPLLVPGDLMNLKVTWPADFALATRWLEKP